MDHETAMTRLVEARERIAELEAALISALEPDGVVFIRQRFAADAWELVREPFIDNGVRYSLKRKS